MDNEKEEIEKWEAEDKEGKTASGGAAGGTLTEKKVKDREFYDLLGVPTSATQRKSKKLITRKPGRFTPISAQMTQMLQQSSRH